MLRDANASGKNEQKKKKTKKKIRVLQAETDKNDKEEKSELGKQRAGDNNTRSCDATDNIESRPAQ